MAEGGVVVAVQLAKEVAKQQVHSQVRCNAGS